MRSIAKAMKDALEATGYSESRDYQRKTMEAYLSGRNVFVSAPTGAGKSLTFELAPYTFNRLFGEDCNAIVLVIVPFSPVSLFSFDFSHDNLRSGDFFLTGEKNNSIIVFFFPRQKKKIA